MGESLKTTSFLENFMRLIFILTLLVLSASAIADINEKSEVKVPGSIYCKVEDLKLKITKNFRLYPGSFERVRLGNDRRLNIDLGMDGEVLIQEFRPPTKEEIDEFDRGSGSYPYLDDRFVFSSRTKAEGYVNDVVAFNEDFSLRCDLIN
jgi:hypothetical protein